MPQTADQDAYMWGYVCQTAMIDYRNLYEVWHKYSQSISQSICLIQVYCRLSYTQIQECLYSEYLVYMLKGLITRDMPNKYCKYSKYNITVTRW